MMKIAALALLALLLSCACKPLVEDSSQAALSAGNKNLFLGSPACGIPITKGYGYCPVEKGSEVPDLHIYFFNPGSYAVSDCKLGIFRTASVPGAMEVVVPMAGLKDQLAEVGFCIIKIEAFEFYPDIKSPDQTHQIAVGGIFFVEPLASGFMPEPPKTAIGWCARIGRTTKGRAYLKELSPEDCQ